VRFDVGHGDNNFWFRIALPAIRQGFLPDTISTDMHKRSIMIPRANMMSTLSKFLNMGLTFEQVIERSTVNAARAVGRPDLGHMSEGAPADIAVLRIEKGTFGFVDGGHARLVGDRKLRCALTVRDGVVVWDADGLSSSEWQAAGPYSNFR
jgi:dihydroorotase